MAKNTREVFSSDGTYAYAWINGVSHPQLTGELLQTDAQEQTEGSILIIGSTVVGTNACTVTAQLRMTPPGATEVWGPEHNLLDTSSSPVNTFTASVAGAKFEANLFEQSWWKPNYGVRILVSRASDTLINLQGFAIIKN